MAIVRGRAKKKIFGRKRASYDARIDKFVPNDKRVPSNIQVEVGRDDALTPAVGGVDCDKGQKRRYGDTILSSLTVPTVATTNTEEDDLDFDTNDQPTDHGKDDVPTTSRIPTLEKTTTRHLLTEEFRVDTERNVSAPSRSKQQLASTKKRLTYGIQEELLDPMTTTSNHDATVVLLAEKCKNTVSQYDVKAALSRRRIAQPSTKSNSARTTNTTTNKRKATSSHRDVSSSQPGGSIVRRKVFGDKTNVGKDTTHTRYWKCEFLFCHVVIAARRGICSADHNIFLRVPLTIILQSFLSLPKHNDS